MANYETPKVDVNESGWGPTTLPEQFLNVPYAPFNKNDKLGKVADFTSTYQNRSNRYGRDPSGVNAEFQYKHDSAEDASFQLVDSAKSTRPRTMDRLRPTWNQQRGRGGRGGRGGMATRGQPEDKQSGHQSQQFKMKGQQKLNKRWNRLSNARRMFNNRRTDEVKIDRAASVKVQGDWTMLQQFELSQLTKLQANVPKAEDAQWCNALHEYDNGYDRLTSKSNRKLQRFDDRDFYYATTTDDPVIEAAASKGECNVFATDAILSHLMACTRSVYPWDIVVQKVNGMLFFDKRDNSNFDLVSVNENASEPPHQDDKTSINHPDRLALEATMINQNLTQQVVKNDGAKSLDHPHPFASEEEKPATFGYRYRQFDLGNDMKLLTRCELHGVVRKNGKEQYMNAFALNEYDPKVAGGIEWRKKIDSQRGAILANELKNNSCKLARWTAQALVSGATEMKLAYVSRANYKDPYNHVVLGVQSYQPPSFATQIALSQTNMWGIIKMLATLLREQDEGKYVLMKDPNKPIVRLYAVPEHTFEDDEVDYEETIEEGEEEEE